MWPRTQEVREAHLWHADWSSTPGGDALIELVTRTWTSEGSAEVDADGQIRFRGFHGDYLLQVDGRQYHVTLGSRQKQAVVVAEHDDKQA